MGAGLKSGACRRCRYAANVAMRCGISSAPPPRPAPPAAALPPLPLPPCPPPEVLPLVLVVNVVRLAVADGRGPVPCEEPPGGAANELMMPCRNCG